MSQRRRRRFEVCHVFMYLCYAMAAGHAAAGASTAGASDAELRSRVDKLFAEYDHWDRPGLAVAVVRDGELFYARGYGSANLEYHVPITPSTVFHVASVSKQFTCFAVLLLAADGKLSLDDDVRKHVPQVPDLGHTITLRHLMHHTSGLRDQWELLGMGGWRMDDVITRDQILKMISRQRELNFPPGAEYLYCNMGYTLLAEVVANVSGKPFAEFADERIFKPLGMAHTHFHDDHERIVPNRAYSYQRSSGTYRHSVLSFANAGATSLFTTAEDLARWLVNLDRGTVGGADLHGQMHGKGKLNDGEEINYALGLEHGMFRGQQTVGHGGVDAGYRAHAVRFPGCGLGIVILGNLAAVNAQGSAMRVAEVMLADKLDGSSTPSDASDSTAPVEVPTAELEKLAGTYRLTSGSIVKLKVSGQQLVGILPGSFPVSMSALSSTEFANRQSNSQIAFAASGSPVATTFTATLGGSKVQGTRVEAKEPADLAEFAGRYYSPELDTAYELTASDGKLVARHQRHNDFTLKPWAGDEFTTSAWYFRTIRFERGEDGKIIGFRGSSHRARNLKFERQAVSE